MPQQDTRKLARSFSNLDKFVHHKTHLLRIRLFFQLLGLGGSEVAECVQLTNFHAILNAKYGPKALDLMQYILSLVGVSQCKIADLDQEALTFCKKVLSYPSAVVGVCIQISIEDFKQLQTLAGEHLECHPKNIETMEKLCWSLHRNASISSSDVYFLSQWMEEVGRLDLAKGLDNYNKTGVYEDPVISSSLGSGTFSPPPTQATNDDDPDQNGKTVVTFSLASGGVGGGATQDIDVERDAGPTTLERCKELDAHLKPIGNQMVTVTSFTKENAATDTPSLTPQASISSTASDEDVPETEKLLSQVKGNDVSGLQIFQNERTRSRCRINRRCICLVLLIIGTVVALLVAVGVCIWLGVANIPFLNLSQTKYATKEMVVIVADFSDPLSLSASSIWECPGGEDFSHTNELFIIPKDQLLHRSRNNSKVFPTHNLTHPQCSINFLTDHFYLLSGSQIDFSICLTSLEDEPTSGTLLLFDNNPAYSKYIRNGNCDDIDGTRLHHHLFIGNNGDFMCTNISFTSLINGYHYIIANTPGNIRLSYKYTYKQYYLNKEDFPESPKCTFSKDGDNDCKLGAISKTPVVLAVSVEKGNFDNSFSTHVCIVTNWSSVLIRLLAALCVLCVLCVACLVACCVCLLCLCCKK